MSWDRFELDELIASKVYLEQCICGRLKFSARFCLRCKDDGNETRLCPKCSPEESGLCVMHFHKQFRTRGCGCHHCRRAQAAMTMIRQLQEIIKQTVATFGRR